MKYTFIETGDYCNNLNEFFTISDNKTLEPKELEKIELDLLKKANTFLVFGGVINEKFFSEWKGFLGLEKIYLKTDEVNEIFFTYSFFIRNYEQLNNFILALDEKQITYFKIFSTLKSESNNIPFKCPDCAADLEWKNDTNTVKFIKHNT